LNIVSKTFFKNLYLKEKEFKTEVLVMPVNYKVKEGDCVASISCNHGFHPDTIWNHPDNAQIKVLRKDQNVLFPGDVIVIPDKEIKIYDRPTGQLHQFRRKAVPEMFRLRLAWFSGPRADLPYTLIIDGTVFIGETDGDGIIEHPIPPNARKGKLIISDDEHYEFQLGSLDPTDEDMGALHRLVNLGYLQQEKMQSMMKSQQGMQANTAMMDQMQEPGTADKISIGISSGSLTATTGSPHAHSP
jgi:N-acetylmuramoyl-L-alanine amidase